MCVCVWGGGGQEEGDECVTGASWSCAHSVNMCVGTHTNERPRACVRIQLPTQLHIAAQGPYHVLLRPPPCGMTKDASTRYPVSTSVHHAMPAIRDTAITWSVYMYVCVGEGRGAW